MSKNGIFRRISTANILLALIIITGCQSIKSTQTYQIGNKNISRTISCENGILQTTSVNNLLTGENISFAGKEFSIKLDDGKVISATTTQVTNVEQTAQQLTISLTDKQLPGTAIEVVYELKESDLFGRKWIEIIPASGTTLAVDQLSVDNLTTLNKVTSSHHGTGQPVYLNALFFGLEWATADNFFHKGQLTCSHFPAWDIKEKTVSKSALWGAAPKGEVSNWFIEKYLPTVRISQPKSTLVYNSWDDVRGPKMDKYDETIKVFRDNMINKGVTMDSVVVDDGWQDKNSIYKSRFTDGFDKLRYQVKADLNGTSLGLWMPISGGYSGLNRKWGKQNGYEINKCKTAFCLLVENNSTVVSWKESINSALPWTAETPNLYTLLITLKNSKGTIMETVTNKIDFRTVKIVNKGEVLVTSIYTLPSVYSAECIETYRVVGSGDVIVNLSYTPGKAPKEQAKPVAKKKKSKKNRKNQSTALPGMPRFGMKLQLPAGFEKLSWYGRGPYENYWDSKTASHVGIYKSTVKDQFFPYASPQETGYKTDTRWMALRNDKGVELLTVAEKLISFSTLHYSTEDFQQESRGKKHLYDLPNRPEVFVNIDDKQIGVGGDNSWGAKPHAQYTLKNEKQSYTFRLRPFSADENPKQLTEQTL